MVINGTKNFIKWNKKKLKKESEKIRQRLNMSLKQQHIGWNSQCYNSFSTLKAGLHYGDCRSKLVHFKAQNFKNSNLERFSP